MEPGAAPLSAPRPGWLRHWLGRFGRRGLDLVYPAHCPGCGSGTAEPGALCGPCWQKMPFIARPFCERLGTPFAIDIGGPLLSPAAIAEPPAFDRARAVALHQGDARAFVHRLKYSDRLDLARPMGRMMAASCAEVLEGADLLVPVPLHWTRFLMRRFNQSAALAGEISALSGVPVGHDLIRRKKRTPRQIGLSRAERIANLQGAFVCPPAAAPAIEGRRLVLVDDVHTTGATLNACARVLRRAGAANIDVVTFTKVADLMANPYEGETRGDFGMTPEITIYTKGYCPYCADAKALLSSKGAAFTEIDVGRDRAEFQTMVSRSGGRVTVPQIFIGATHVGGCDDIYALEARGGLDPLLKG